MADQMTPAEFAQKIKAKHPGAYDDIPDEELAQKVLAKYPQYRGDVKTHFEMERELGKQPGVLESAGRTLKGLLMPAGQNPYPGMGLDQKQDAFRAAQDADQHRIDTGRSVPYRAAATLLSPIADVQGMEDAAERANPSGVIGHAAGSILPLAAGPVLSRARVPVGEGLKNRSYGIYNNVLGTKGADMAFEGNPGRGVAQEGITGSRSRLLDKIDASIKTRSPQIDEVLGLPQNAAKTIDISQPVTRPFNEALRSGTKGALSDATLKRLSQTQGELTMERSAPGEYTGQPKNMKLSPLDANNIKRDIQGRTNYVNPENDEIVNSTLRRSARGVRDAVNESVPEVAPFNKRVQDLSEAHDALANRINRRLTNPSNPGFGDFIPATLGRDIAGGPGAIAGIATKEILGSTPVKTLAAQGLYRAGNLLSPDAPLVVPKPEFRMPTPIRGMLKAPPIQLGSNMEPIDSSTSPLPTPAFSTRAVRMGRLLPEKASTSRPIQLGSQTEPIEDVGPMSQPAEEGRQGFRPVFRTSSKFPRGIRLPESPYGGFGPDDEESDIEQARRR